jgi:protein SCO1/2
MPRSIIGAPFELTSPQRTTLTDKTFRGQWLIVFFGYTFCPDVCPTTLMTLTETFELLGSKAQNVSALFITLDPRRDTPELLSQYMSHFSPRIVAATGTDAQIEAAVKAFRVRYEIDGDVASGQYTISHPVSMMLFDPRGQFVTLIPGGTTAKDVSRTVQRFIGTTH